MVFSRSKQKPLFITAVILSILFWLGLLWLAHYILQQFWPIIGPEYLAVAVLSLIILIYFFDFIRRARQMAYLRGNAVLVSKKQHPDLFSRLKTAGKRLKLEEIPEMFLFNGPLQQDSFAVRYQGQKYIAINASITAALTDRQGAIDYALGYELGKVSDRYSRWDYFIYPTRVLPVIGSAYARAKIYNYDAYGIRACKAKVDAAFVLSVYASGNRRWKSLNIPDFAGQSNLTRQFWMSVFELVSGRPWLSKRMAHLRAIATKSDTFIPRRNPFAYIVTILIPYLAPIGPALAIRILFVFLWGAILAYAVNQGYHELAKREMLGFLQSRFEGKAVRVPGTSRPSTPSTSRKKTNNNHKTSTLNAYTALRDDLVYLGKLTLERQKRYGGNPCEIGNVSALKLNYSWKRYAFSCDEPIVYTSVEQGEFVPGHKAHIQSYNWKLKKFVKGVPTGN